ncbi:MAG: hypothetical protein IJH98_04810 [Solobacterium sp.]|nr:hypothetical protein [Solobacterium sp.]
MLPNSLEKCGIKDNNKCGDQPVCFFFTFVLKQTSNGKAPGSLDGTAAGGNHENRLQITVKQVISFTSCCLPDTAQQLYESLQWQSRLPMADNPGCKGYQTERSC